MKTLKCILLDDELLALSLLRTMCEGIPEIEVVKAFNDPQLFLNQIEELEFDFYISDIVMPHQNGLEVKNALKHKPVIFCSAHPQFAIDAFDVNAVDFLKKPVTPERLRIAIQKIIQRLELPEDETLWQVNTSMGKLALSPSSIVAISSSSIDPRDKMVVLSDQRIVVVKNKSFHQIESELHQISLKRSSKNTLIHLKMIEGYNGDRILFAARLNLKPEIISAIQHLSEAYRKDFIQALSNK